MKVSRFCFLFLAVLLAVSCTTTVIIPDDMPPNKLVQRAQEASDNNKYKVSLQYYQALKERYGDSDEYLCTAEYEIAFIHYKQKKYTEARNGFTVLLARYNEVDAELLPPAYKILAEKVLARMTEMGY